MDRNEAINILRVIAPPRTSKKAFYDFMEARDMAIAALEQTLPQAQVESLTDREQRIFLAAISREKEVCKEVDYQFSNIREPYEDTLVNVCKEIERKVKAALWTN